MSHIKFSTLTLLFSCSLILIFSSCKETKEIEVDHKRWRTDLVDCGGYRKKVYKSIIKNNQQYIGMQEEDVTAQLGLPEKEALEKRMKKSIRYQVSGYDCDTSSTIKKFLVFELESLRRVRSIYVIVDK